MQHYSVSRAPPHERLLTIFCLVVSTIYDLTSYVAAPLKKEHALPHPGYDSSHLASIYMYICTMNAVDGGTEVDVKGPIMAAPEPLVGSKCLRHLRKIETC